MAEFFGFGGYTRPAEGFLSWQHLTFVTALMAVMVLLAVFLLLMEVVFPWLEELLPWTDVAVAR